MEEKIILSNPPSSKRTRLKSKPTTNMNVSSLSPNLHSQSSLPVDPRSASQSNLQADTFFSSGTTSGKSKYDNIRTLIDSNNTIPVPMKKEERFSSFSDSRSSISSAPSAYPPSFLLQKNPNSESHPSLRLDTASPPMSTPMENNFFSPNFPNTYSTNFSSDPKNLFSTSDNSLLKNCGPPQASTKTFMSTAAPQVTLPEIGGGYRVNKQPMLTGGMNSTPKIFVSPPNNSDTADVGKYPNFSIGSPNTTVISPPKSFDSSTENLLQISSSLKNYSQNSQKNGLVVESPQRHNRAKSAGMNTQELKELEAKIRKEVEENLRKEEEEMRRQMEEQVRREVEEQLRKDLEEKVSVEEKVRLQKEIRKEVERELDEENRRMLENAKLRVKTSGEGEGKPLSGKLRLSKVKTLNRKSNFRTTLDAIQEKKNKKSSAEIDLQETLSKEKRRRGRKESPINFQLYSQNEDAGGNNSEEKESKSILEKIGEKIVLGNKGGRAEEKKKFPMTKVQYAIKIQSLVRMFLQKRSFKEMRLRTLAAKEILSSEQVYISMFQKYISVRTL